MAQTLIRGSTDIRSGTISWDRMAAGAIVPTSSLVDGANFLNRAGTVPLTADWSIGGTLKITGSADAVNPTDLVNLRTMQSFNSGMGLRVNVRAVSNANAALTGVQNFDGVVGVAGDDVLLVGQTTPAQNGPWRMAAAAWVRPPYWAAASTQRPALFFVTEGTTYDNTKWTTTTNGPITVDTTAVAIAQDTSGGTYVNGNGLSLTGNSFAVKLGSGVSFDGSQQVTLTPDPVGLLSVGAAGIRVAAGTPAQIPVVNGSNNLAYVSMSGNVTISSTGVTAVDNTASTGFAKFSNFVFGEVPAGLVNGVNTTFTLAVAPVANTDVVYINGIRRERGAGNDYTITGNTITTLFVLLPGDKIQCDSMKP
jgi:hypothetical protein